MDKDKPYMQRKWQREEVVILVVEYFRTKHLSNEEINVNIKRISELLRKREMMLTGNDISDTFRDFSGIRMQYGRIRCLDPETQYDGMIPTKLQKQVYNEYILDTAGLEREADEIIKMYS